MTVQEVSRTEISSDDVARFRENGFVRLRNVLTPAAVERLRSAMAQALETFGASPSSYDVTAMADALWSDETEYDTGGSRQHDLSAFATAIRTAGHPRLLEASSSVAPAGRFLVDTSIWRRVELLADFALHGPLPKIASALLDTGRVRYYDDQLSSRSRARRIARRSIRTFPISTSMETAAASCGFRWTPCARAPERSLTSPALTNGACSTRTSS